MRKLIFIIIAIALLAGAVWVAGQFKSDQSFAAPPKANITSVFTDTVKNQSIPVIIEAGGNIAARDRLEIFSEVQGVFIASAHSFKPGTPFRKGELLLRINAEEHKANINAQKSALYNQLVQLLPDLKLDYPESFSQWESYILSFDVETPLKPLPAAVNDRERLFIAGRNIYSTYYTVKNLEERLTKYVIRAPYSGMLTSALVDPGTLIRAGQSLGTFINTGTYEVQIPVAAALGDYLEIGQEVQLNNIEKTKTWTGKIVRINRIVNTTTQTIPVFIEVSGPDLREGMYLMGQFEGREVPDAYEISRKLLIDDRELYVVRDSSLNIIPVEPIYFKDQTAIVRGIPEGSHILARSIPGAYSGMRVQVMRQESKTN